MAELPDAINALLHVAVNSSPFNLSGSNPLYEAVKFKSGFPRGSMETPTVALYEFGGANQPQGLGTIKQWRDPTIRVDVLAETGLDALRIIEKLRDAWRADFDCEGSGDVGDVGNGYVRETGTVKSVGFAEPRDAPWDDVGRVKRKIFDLTIRFGD